MSKLAVLGASYLQLPLVVKAKSLGIEVHCFAWDSDEAVCKPVADFFYNISVLEQEQILEQCRAIGIDGITTIATDICVPTICYVAQKLGLVSNSYESALHSTNKAMMRQRFFERHVSSPRFVTVAKFTDVALEEFSYPVIVKPTDRSGSRGVTKVEDASQLEMAVERGAAESFEKKCVVEEFIDGVEISVESISWQGQHTILAITDKVTTGEPYFVELEHHQPSALAEAIQDRIKTETIKALDALDIRYGAGHSEFKITADGRIFIIEVGARMGGDFIGSHLVPLSTGYDFVEGVIDVALNRFKIPTIKNSGFAGVYFLCNETRNLLPYFYQQNAFDFDKKMLHPELKDIRNSNDRSGYLIYKSDRRVELKGIDEVQ